MLSLKAFDDFVVFLVSTSDCCSGFRSCAVDATDDFLESVDVGERILKEGFDGIFRVFFTWSVVDEESAFDSVDFVDFTLIVRRGVVELAGPVVFGKSYKLVLEGRFNLRGLLIAVGVSCSAELPFVDKDGALAGIRDLDGSRVVVAGWDDRRSLPIGWREEDDRDGDLE